MSTAEPERLIVDLSPAPAADAAEIRAWAAGQSVFVSSVMGGMTEEREAVVRAIQAVGAAPVWFENFGGRDDDPEDAYLGNVASSDIYIGVLGGRYGKPARSGYSATHAEYNEAIRRGLRISVWNATGDLDGRQQDFLADIRTFHTTGAYTSADDLAKRVGDRLRTLAAESLAPWVKVGNTVFRATSVQDDGQTIIVKARVRDNTLIASLESRRPTQSYGRHTDAQITWPGATTAARITAISAEVTTSRARSMTITATRLPNERAGTMEVSFEGRSPEDLTELGLRVAMFGETNPLGTMSFLVKAQNPLPSLSGLGLSEDSFEQVAELLMIEELVGCHGADHLTSFRLGPPQAGRRHLFVSWIPHRRYQNVDPVERHIEGDTPS
jgi:hypothetical protein